jgi:rod shape-determining protein MreD
MKWIKIILTTIIVILLQVTIFNRLQINGWGYPMVYILLLLNIPPQKPRWIEMLVGTLVGLIIDICNNSLGVHMAACVALAYLRPIILKKSVQDVERIKDEICSRSVGFIEYLKCIVLLTILHHLMVFGLEAWSIQNWLLIVLQTLCSSFLTILLLLGYDLIRR